MIGMQEHLEKRKEILYGLKLTVQPFAAVIGEIENPSQILVVLDSYFYEVESVLKAVDVTFKCIHALHVDYPPEADQMWLFLQHYVYGFKTRFDKHHSNSSSLGNRYIAFKQSLSLPSPA